MYNLRYHIASLVAVFLALALGLVLGGLIVNTTAGDQTGIVSGLEQEFDKLRSENSMLKKQATADAQFSDELTRQAVSGRLKGKTVAVVGLNSKAADLARQSLVEAGATPVSVTVVAKKLDLKNTTAASTTEINKLTAAQGADADIYAAMGTQLAAEWKKDVAERPLTKALIADGVIKIENYDTFKGIDALLDTAINDQKPESIAFELARATTAAGMPTVATSMSEGTGALAKAATKADIAAIDTLGTPMGTYSITALLLGSETGYYGMGDGAKALYPTMPAKVSAVPLTL